MPVLGRNRAGGRQDVRRAYIEGYSFPAALRERAADKYEPSLAPSQASLVFEGLRTWFLACLIADGKQLGMPSRAVDDAWHEFILFTRDYHAFCHEAFGRYLHHTPDTVLREPLDDALVRTLDIVTKHRLHPADRLGDPDVPFLFRIDRELDLEDGQQWTKSGLERLRNDRVGTGGGCAGGGGDGGGGGGCGGGCGGG